MDDSGGSPILRNTQIICEQCLFYQTNQQQPGEVCASRSDPPGSAATGSEAQWRSLSSVLSRDEEHWLRISWGAGAIRVLDKALGKVSDCYLSSQPRFLMIGLLLQGIWLDISIVHLSSCFYPLWNTWLAMYPQTLLNHMPRNPITLPVLHVVLPPSSSKPAFSSKGRREAWCWRTILSSQQRLNAPTLHTLSAE